MIRYLDTRGAISAPRTFTEAILEGIAPGGGLFVPERLPRTPGGRGASRWRRSRTTRGRRRSTRPSASTSPPPARARSPHGPTGPTSTFPRSRPVREVTPGRHVLELWHGPTLAFKDMALQCMPLYFSEAAGAGARARAPPSLRLPHPGGDQRRHRRGGAQRLRRSRPHQDLRLLPRRRRLGAAGAADGHAAGRQPHGVPPRRRLRRLPELREGGLRRRRVRDGARRTAPALAELGQLHQLGPAAAADRVLRERLRRPRRRAAR